MSESKPIQVPCSGCQTSLSMNYYDVLNVSSSPELKEHLFNHKINILTCESCGQKMQINNGLLYHDAGQEVLIQCLEAESEEILQGKLAELNELQEGEDYTKRLVLSYNNLIDKVRIFDDNLDDAAVELCKCFLITSYFKTRGEEPDSVFYSGKENEDLTFVFFAKSGQSFASSVPQNIYENVLIRHKDKLEEIRANKQWLALDTNYAFRELMSEELSSE